MPKWHRITMYVTAGAMGLGGAVLGYGKPLTMLAILAVTVAVEGVNYLIQRRKEPSFIEAPTAFRFGGRAQYRLYSIRPSLTP